MCKKASLYIHIPFCSNKCYYCDFYSVVNKDLTLFELYINSVLEDIKYQIEYFDIHEIPTVYIGGGTPSVLGVKNITFLLNELKKIPAIKPLEFTIEVNPETAKEDFLKACLLGGVSRLSLGVQTFNEQSRKTINRAGDSKKLIEHISLVSKYFTKNFCVDLITGLPYQTEKILIKDIENILEFEPSHISLYSLTLEKDTPLEKKVRSKEITLPNSEKADSLWLLGRDFLIQAGYEHYEVSSFAKERCKHNIRYWQMENWLGAGPAASATIIDEDLGTAKRYTYKRDIKSYIDKPNIQNAMCEEIDKNSLIYESLLMGFRCSDGVNKEKFKKRFGMELQECIPKTLDQWKDKDKMLFLNSFLCDALTELSL